jgi:type VI secretion system secreted protein VgrG
MDMNEDAVHTIGRRAALTVGKVTLRDWNPEHPSLDMDVAAPGPTPAGPEFYDYPGEYLEPGAGARKVKLISESFACAAAAVVGKSFCGRFAPGFTFTLEGAPAGASDGEHALTSVTHEYRRDKTGFSIAFEALPGDIIFRPARVTHVPRILNPVTGFVTGPAGDDDIYTDEYGRIKVHFHWDRRLPPDDDCSHWIPVLQDNTGQSSAMPRIGWEVLVHFMEGDPDRPVCLGRVYNAEDTFSVPLPARKTCTSLKSLSSPTRDGTNEIQFDDLDGKEYIQIHAERDQNIVVANDKTETILINESSIVRHNETITIGANHTMSAGRDIIPQISGNQSWTTGANRSRFITGGETNNILGSRSLTVGAMHHLKVDDSSSTTATLLVEQIGGMVLEVFKKSNATEAGENAIRVIGGAAIELAEENKAETTVKKRIETIGAVLFQKAGGEMKTKGGELRRTNVAGSLTVRSVKQLAITGAEKIKTLSATASHTASKDVTLKVKNTTIVLKDGVIKIVTPTAISLKISGENQQGAGQSFQI